MARSGRCRLPATRRAAFLGCAILFASTAGAAPTGDSAAAAVDSSPTVPPAPPPTGPLARLGTQVLTTSDLDDDARARIAGVDKELADQLKRIESDYRLARYATLESEAQRLLNDRILAAEAAKRHVSKDALLESIPYQHVTDAEAKRIYDEHAEQINRPYAVVEKDLKAQLEGERVAAARKTYFDGLMKKYEAEILVAPVRVSVAASGPSTEPVDAPVTIILFSDFQCPYCARVVPTLNELLAKHPQEVRLVYRHFPLSSIHPNATGAAEASVCADRQGRFWDMYQAFFAAPSKLGKADIEATAARLNLDMAAFRQCVDSGAAAAAVAADAATADDLGLSGTPVLFINGRTVTGAPTLERLEAIIASEQALLANRVR